MPYKPDLPCADCGKLMWRARTSLPEGQARCLPCRRARPTHRKADPRSPCITCGKPSYGERCQQCAAACRPSTAPANEARRLLGARRADRDKLAPGPYTAWWRQRLLARWKKQQKLCVYCKNAPVETVDHVLPLALGGTNYEGNLAPACHDCNRSKLDNLLSAWRYGVKVHKWRVPVEPRLPKVRRRRTEVELAKVTGTQVVMHICDICGEFTTTKTCSYECHRSRMRNRYRARVGIPLDAPLLKVQPRKRDVA